MKKRKDNAAEEIKNEKVYDNFISNTKPISYILVSKFS